MLSFITESIASIVEVLILFSFMISCLTYKPMKKGKKIIGTVFFLLIHFLAVTVFNYFMLYEGVLSLLYVLLSFLFCRVMLQGNWTYQGIIVLLEYSFLFLIDLLTALSAGKILQKNESEIMMMQGMPRIFFLVLTKVLIALLLYFIYAQMQKKSIWFYSYQGIFVLLIVFATFLIGILFEELEITYQITGWESSVILLGLIVLDGLFFWVIYQVSARNKEREEKRIQEITLQNEKEKTEQNAKWNRKLSFLRHDMRMYLYDIDYLLQKNRTEDAVQCVQKLSEKLYGEIPRYTSTASTFLNAVLDIEKQKCKEKQIDIKCSVSERYPKEIEFALCEILLNLLDNAIEAEEKEDVKKIELVLLQDEERLHMQIKNKIDESVLKTNAQLKTTKRDSVHHGYGLEIVRSMVREQNGDLDIYEENDWFVADVRFIKKKK